MDADNSSPESNIWTLNPSGRTLEKLILYPDESKETATINFEDFASLLRSKKTVINLHKEGAVFFGDWDARYQHFPIQDRARRTFDKKGMPIDSNQGVVPLGINLKMLDQLLWSKISEKALDGLNRKISVEELEHLCPTLKKKSKISFQNDHRVKSLDEDIARIIGASTTTRSSYQAQRIGTKLKFLQRKFAHQYPDIPSHFVGRKFQNVTRENNLHLKKKITKSDIETENNWKITQDGRAISQYEWIPLMKDGKQSGKGQDGAEIARIPLKFLLPQNLSDREMTITSFNEEKREFSFSDPNVSHGISIKKLNELALQHDFSPAAWATIQPLADQENVHFPGQQTVSTIQILSALNLLQNAREVEFQLKSSIKLEEHRELQAALSLPQVADGVHVYLNNAIAERKGKDIANLAAREENLLILQAQERELELFERLLPRYREERTVQSSAIVPEQSTEAQSQTPPNESLESNKPRSNWALSADKKSLERFVQYPNETTATESIKFDDIRWITKLPLKQLRAHNAIYFGKKNPLYDIFPFQDKSGRNFNPKGHPLSIDPTLDSENTEPCGLNTEQLDRALLTKLISKKIPETNRPLSSEELYSIFPHLAKSLIRQAKSRLSSAENKNDLQQLHQDIEALIRRTNDKTTSHPEKAAKKLRDSIGIFHSKYPDLHSGSISRAVTRAAKQHHLPWTRNKKLGRTDPTKAYVETAQNWKITNNGSTFSQYAWIPIKKGGKPTGAGKDGEELNRIPVEHLLPEEFAGRGIKAHSFDKNLQQFTLSIQDPKLPSAISIDRLNTLALQHDFSPSLQALNVSSSNDSPSINSEGSRSSRESSFSLLPPPSTASNALPTQISYQQGREFLQVGAGGASPPSSPRNNVFSR